MKELRRSVFTAFLAVFIFVAAGPVWAGSLRLYNATYLGGGVNDYGWGIAVDNSGNTYVTGFTNSTDFPTGQAFQGTNAGNEDAFVSKLAPGGTALVYSTYLGGTGVDRGLGIAVDGSGNAYVTGRCDSSDFPTVQPINGTLGGSRDAFVSKLAPSGTALTYSTYLGGGAVEQGKGIALDGSGNAYVTGYTESTDFPTVQPINGTLGGSRDAFVSKLAPSGTALTYSTYLGGGNKDRGARIAVDVSGNAYVTGRTNSIDFPTAQPFQGALSSNYDVFVSKLAPSGTALTYSTYLGGAGDDQSKGLALDGSGNAYVTGISNSTDFPTGQAFQGTNAGDYDAFVSKLASSGTALIYSTYLGGTGTDEGNGIALDPSGKAYVAGKSNSTNFPTVQPFQGTNAGDYDAFFSKLSSSGTALVYSTYLGGAGTDQGNRIASDGSGNAYVTGSTNSTDFPTRQAYQGTNAGGYDAFVFTIGMPDVGDELAVNFVSKGLWHYDHKGPTWTAIAGSADDLENFQGDLAADFGASGLWLYNGAWSGIGGNPDAMEACGTALYVDFGANGLWRYDGAWSGIGGNPDDMQCCGEVLFVDYGANGLWQYDGTWTALSGDPTGMWCADSVFYANISGSLWQYDGTWAAIAGVADALEGCGGVLFADFGANGLWSYNGAWTAQASDPQLMKCCDSDLYVDFNANGLWRYDGAWTALAGDVEDICCSEALYVDLAGGGLWRYDGSWTGLAANTTRMTDVDINP